MSMESLLNLLSVIQDHPYLAGLVVFLIAFSESLAIVGLIMPGALLMVGIGALIALDKLPFWSTTIIATLGAITGDTLSYQLGKHYRHNLSQLWPLSRHPELLPRAENFFQRHGVKSIVFARFVGPLRPVIPAVAGMLEMNRLHFLLANITSAIFWAPLYLLPGILFGLSLEMATEFAGRFVLMFGLLLALIWLVAYIARKIYHKVTPHTERLLSRLMHWSQRHPIAGELSAAVIDPQHPEIKGLSFLAVLLFIWCVLLVSLSKWLFTPSLFAGVDHLLFFGMQSLRNPPFDNIMLWLLFITDSTSLAMLVLITGAWLLYKQNLLGLWHWLAAIALPLLLLPLLQNSLVPLLQNYFTVSVSESGYQFMPGVVYTSALGFFAVMFAREFTHRWHLLIYVLAAGLILLLTLAQLYFGVQSLSEFLLGGLIAGIWLTLLGIAYRRHIHLPVSDKQSLRVLGLLLSLVLLGYPFLQLSHQQLSFNKAEQRLLMGINAWLESGWQALPAYRQDLRISNKYPFNLQWAGSKEQLQQQLQTLGFQKSISMFQKSLLWFKKDTSADQLVILPHVNAGQYETLNYSKVAQQSDHILVVRLWQTAYLLRQDSLQKKLWIGSVSYLEPKSRLGLRYLKTPLEFTSALDEFAQLPGFNQLHTHWVKYAIEGEQGWDGKTLLIN